MSTEMKHVAAWVILTVVGAAVKRTLGLHPFEQAKVDASKINGKIILADGPMKGTAVKSAIPYENGDIEVTVWAMKDGDFHTVLALLKKESRGKTYTYDNAGYHAMIEVAPGRLANLGDAELKREILSAINAALTGTQALQADTNDSELKGDPAIVKVGAKLRVDKRYKVEGSEPWTVVGVRTFGNSQSQTGQGGKLMFEAKRVRDGNHHSHLVVAYKGSGDNIAVSDAYKAENGIWKGGMLGDTALISKALTTILASLNKPTEQHHHSTNPLTIGD